MGYLSSRMSPECVHRFSCLKNGQNRIRILLMSRLYYILILYLVFVMYSNSVRSFSTLRVKYFVTVATYGVIKHLVKPALKGNQKGPR